MHTPFNPAKSAIKVLRSTLLVLALCPWNARAAAPQDPDHRLWFDAAIGNSWLQRRVPDSPTISDNAYTFHLEGGWRVNRQWLLGLDLGTITIQSNCVDSLYYVCSPSEQQRGKDIEHLFVIAEFHPHDRSGWFVHLGLGPSQATNNQNGYAVDHRGWGADAGAGYAWPFLRSSYLGMRINYEWGHLGGRDGNPPLDYTAPQLLLVWAFN